jgi:hypothetical protein
MEISRRLENNCRVVSSLILRTRGKTYGRLPTIPPCVLLVDMLGKRGRQGARIHAFQGLNSDKTIFHEIVDQVGSRSKIMVRNVTVSKNCCSRSIPWMPRWSHQIDSEVLLCTTRADLILLRHTQ